MVVVTATLDATGHLCDGLDATAEDGPAQSGRRGGHEDPGGGATRGTRWMALPQTIRSSAAPPSIRSGGDCRFGTAARLRCRSMC